MKKQNSTLDLEISPQYLVDESGKKTGVLLDIATFEQIIESLEDFYFGLEAMQALQEDEHIDFAEANKDILPKK